MAKPGDKDVMQFHHGSRLQNYIEKSHLLIKDITEKSDVAKSSLYDMFKREELLPSKVAPILKVLEKSIAEFYGFTNEVSGNQLNEASEPYGLKALYEAVVRENETLRELIKQKDATIELLKNKTKRK